MEFEFAKYTEVTELAFRVNSEYKNAGYTRIFLCPDVNDAQLIRVLPGYSHDYEPAIHSCIVEHEMINNRYKGEPLTAHRAQSILKNDDFSNWDYHVFPNDMEKVIDSIDNGYGILNLQSA